MVSQQPEDVGGVSLAAALLQERIDARLFGEHVEIDRA
jgi:hypothetical protein